MSKQSEVSSFHREHSHQNQFSKVDFSYWPSLELNLGQGIYTKSRLITTVVHHESKFSLIKTTIDGMRTELKSAIYASYSEFPKKVQT